MRFDAAGKEGSALELTQANGGGRPSTDPSSAGWRWWPTGIEVQTRGCYAMQIDGRDFSTVVVFLALVDVSLSADAHVVRGGCGTTAVYQGGAPEWLVNAAGGNNAPRDLPWFPSPSGLIGGFIFGYPLQAGRGTKILFAVATQRAGHPLMISARPDGESGPVVAETSPDHSSPGEIYPSSIMVPTAGCWDLDLQWGNAQASARLMFDP